MAWCQQLYLNKLNAPRVIRTVEGDFTITVKVRGDFKPGGRPLFSSGPPSVAARATDLKCALEVVLPAGPVAVADPAA